MQVAIDVKQGIKKAVIVAALAERGIIPLKGEPVKNALRVQKLMQTPLQRDVPDVLAISIKTKKERLIAKPALQGL